MFNRSGTPRSQTLALPALIIGALLLAAAPPHAYAQVFESGCYDGAGTFTGDLDSVTDGGIGYDATYDDQTEVSAIRITVFNVLAEEVAGSTAQKFEMPFLEVNADGTFSGSGEATLRLTIEGTYADCGVTGTWLVEDPFDEEYEPLSGTFTMEASEPTPDPAADACAAFGGIVPSMLLLMAGLDYARRRRNCHRHGTLRGA